MQHNIFHVIARFNHTEMSYDPSNSVQQNTRNLNICLGPLLRARATKNLKSPFAIFHFLGFRILYSLAPDDFCRILGAQRRRVYHSSKQSTIHTPTNMHIHSHACMRSNFAMAIKDSSSKYTQFAFIYLYSRAEELFVTRVRPCIFQGAEKGWHIRRTLRSRTFFVIIAIIILAIREKL